ADSAPGELARLHELHQLDMRHATRSFDLRVRREQVGAPSRVTDQQLAVYEIVAQNLVVREQPIELPRVRLAATQEADPDRRVDQNHYAARCLPAGFSRRRRTARASGSDPRNARRRS